jgi:hypothetical protein
MKPRLSLLSLLLASALPLSAATVYEWTFDAGDLSASAGNGVMATGGSASVSFSTTDGAAVPHIAGTPAAYLSVPPFTAGANGLLLTFGDSGPNGGGAYLNQYTILMDIYSPGAAGWQALLNTDTSNGNDADWYISDTGALGIGALTYSPGGAVPQDSWHRLAMSADLGAGVVKYYVDGTLVATRTGASLLDGRFAIYTNAHAGADLLLFNEGDGSGSYVHPLLVNSVAFTDQTLGDSAILSLGGPSSGGILVPEPSAVLLGALGTMALFRRRR